MTRSVSVSVGVALAVVLSVLAASAPPVGAANTSMAASDGLVVGSSHSTADDFQSAQTLANLSVRGSGESASITLNTTAAEFDDFDSEPADSGVPSDWEAVTDPDNRGFSRNSDVEEVTTERAYTGTQSYHLAESATGNTLTSRPAYQPTDPSTSNVSAALYGVSTSRDFDAVFIRLYEDVGSSAPVEVGINESGELVALGPSGQQVISTVPDHGEWVHVTIYSIDPSTGTFAVAWETATDSGVTTGLEMAASMTDGWTDSLIYVNNEGFVDDFEVGSASTPSSATYVSSPHEVSNAEAAAINIEQASNVSVDAEVRTDGGTTLATDTFTSASNHTLNLSTTSSSQLETILDITVTGDDPQFSLADESILFSNHSPEATNLSPEDGAKLQERGTNFSVDVSDPEFPTAQGDSVDAELLVDGEVVGSETVTSNQTVSVTHELTQGGQHTYQWRLTDSYGSTTTTSERTLTVPATLEVRSVVNQTLVDAENATITFYGGPNERDIIERPVTNGTVSLAGLPANTEFTVVVRADGYYTRTAVIPSLYDQSITWLLPKNNTDAVEVVFQLDDRTGDFAGSDSTQLRVQRAVEYNNSTQWYDVVGDDISSTSQLATILENQQRYRLIVSNDQQTRILGSYSTSGPADPEVIPIGRIEFSGETDAGVSLDATLLNETQPAVRIMAFNPDRTADRLVYRVVNTTENESTIIANTTVSNPESFAAVSAPLTDVNSVKGQTYRVDMWAYNGGRLVAHSSASVGKLQGVGFSGILNNGLMTMGGYVFLIAGAYGTANYSPRLGALMGVIIGGALTIYGILSIPHVVLGYTGSIAVIRQVATEG